MKSVTFRKWADREWPGLYDWMVSGERGASSSFLVQWVCGLPAENAGATWPHDEGDFARCAKLVATVPSIMAARGAIDSLLVCIPEWAPWIERLRAASGPLDSHRSDEHLLHWFDPFDGDKDRPDVEMPPKVVKTRKVQVCKAGLDWHDIPIGARALVYRLIDNGKWQGLYCCAKCVDEWLTECGIQPDLAPMTGRQAGGS